MPNSQKGFAHLLLILAAVGVLGFILLSSSGQFKNKLFAGLFPKSASQAASGPVSGPTSPTPSPAAASLSLAPVSGIFNQGCALSVNIQVNTGNRATAGTDAILLYDQSKLTPVSVLPGSLYRDTIVQQSTSSGALSVSGISGPPPDPGFAGSGVLAKVNFKVNANASLGTTAINFDFDPNNKSKTTDSNVVEKGTVIELLSLVSNGSYTINTGVCPANPYLPGDINQSNRVDIFDYNLLVTDFNKSDLISLRSDLDGNGRVDIFDYNIIITNFGRTQ